MRQRTFYFWLGLAFVLTCAQASANRLDVFGGGARGQGLGGAGGTLIDGHSALYFNPASLSLGEVAATLSLDGAYDRTAILLMDRPAGYAPPTYGDRIQERQDLDDARKVGTVLVGLKMRPFDEDLTIAFMALTSLEGLGRISTAFPDEREQFFSNQLRYELLGERMRGELYAVGGSFRLRPWVSLGLGVLLLPNISVNTRVLTPNPSDPSEAELNYEVESGMGQALTAGILLTPSDEFRVGLGFQDSVNLQLRGANLIELAGVDGGVVQQTFEVAQSYSPLRLTVSTSYEAPSGWQVALDSTWRAWSRYLNHHGAAAGFENTFDFKMGFELPFDRRSVFRLGGGYVPSPVGPQTGRTNYVDNDRVILGLGGGRRLNLWGQRLELVLSLQFQGLLARTTRKTIGPEGAAEDCGPGVTTLCDEVPDRDADQPGAPAWQTRGVQTGNPGFPGYTHGGYVVSAGMEIRWYY